VFNRSAANDNTFRDYTIIIILYCTADFHAGNVIHSYEDSNHQPVTQVGRYNIETVIHWIQEQQTITKQLSTTFTSLVIMGCSAGSLATQLWSKELLSIFQWKKAAVVPDSALGVFPVEVEGLLFRDIDFCSAPFLSTNLYTKCVQKQCRFEDINQEFIASYPQVPFAFIHAKLDEVQLSFYDLMGMTSIEAKKKFITPKEFYNTANDMMGVYNSEHKNFVTYLIDGLHHCYTEQDLYYTTNTLGTEDDGSAPQILPLYQWLNQLPLESDESISTVCDGALKISSSIIEDNTYCSTKVLPKTYTQR